jgi:hypothetical protein
MTRRRVAFSGENTDVGRYCEYWKGGKSNLAIEYITTSINTVIYSTGCSSWIGQNFQCWHDEQKGWLLDDSFPLGAGGDTKFWLCLEDTRNLWIRDTGCRTG